MIARSFTLAALALALSVTAALAADPPAPAEKERPICRRAERSLGSHIRAPRRCRTAEQWQQEAQAEADAKAQAPLALQVTEGQNDGLRGAAPR